MKLFDINENTESWDLNKLTYREILNLESECNKAIIQVETAPIFNEAQCNSLYKKLRIIRDSKSLSEKGIPY